MIPRALRPAALLLSGLLAAGCQSTLTAVSLPADSPWTSMATYVASPYDDLTVAYSGTGIVASVLPSNITVANSAFHFCEGPDGDHDIAPAGLPCVEGYTDKGVVYGWMVQINVAADFSPGSVSLISNSDGATALSFSLAKGGTSPALNITAGFSEGTIAMQPPAGDPGIGGAYMLDNYGVLLFGPSDPLFGSGTSLSAIDGRPDLLCSGDAGFPGLEDLNDAVLFRTSGSSLTATCGSRTINLTITPPYKSVGACISDARKRFCAGKGYKGTALASCNAAQIGACQATFNVPSRLALGSATP